MDEYKYMNKKKPYPTWVYHKKLDAKIICSSELDKHLEDGWKQSPVEFCHIPDFGIEPDDKQAVQGLGEVVTGIAECMDGELNLEKMTSVELDKFSNKHLSIEYKGSKKQKVEKIREELQASKGDAVSELEEPAKEV